jgi:hypothetical protein
MNCRVIIGCTFGARDYELGQQGLAFCSKEAQHQSAKTIHYEDLLTPDFVCVIIVALWLRRAVAHAMDGPRFL